MQGLSFKVGTCSFQYGSRNCCKNIADHNELEMEHSNLVTYFPLNTIKFYSRIKDFGRAVNIFS